MNCLSEQLNHVGGLIELVCSYLLPKNKRHSAADIIETENFLFWSPDISVQLDILPAAAAGGHLFILERVHNEFRAKSFFWVKAMNNAAQSGHLQVVQWLHANR